MKRLMKCRLCAGNFWPLYPWVHVCPDCEDDADFVDPRPVDKKQDKEEDEA